MSTRSAAILAALVSLLGCTEETLLVVDLKTDLIPGREFDGVELDVLDDGLGPVEEVIATSDQSWLEGVRIAELEGLPAGDVGIQLNLVMDEANFARRVRVALEGRTGVTVVMTRACRDVACMDGTANGCLNGICVDAACTEENVAACGDAVCTTDAECATAASDCATPRCVAGACLIGVDDSACADGELCDADLGCAARSRGAAPAIVDADAYPIGRDARVAAAAIGNAGNIYVSGLVLANGSSDLGGGPLPRDGFAYAYLASYDGAGAPRWSTSFGGSGGDTEGQNEATGVAVHMDGVYVTGRALDGVDFGGGPMPPLGGSRPFVASYDSDGAFRWAQRFAADSASPFGIAVDATGVYVVGEMRGDADFGVESHTAMSVDGFILAFELDGTPRWARFVSTTSRQRAYRVWADPGGGPVAAGVFTNSVDFGGGVRSTATHDIFVAGYDPMNAHRFDLAIPVSDEASDPTVFGLARTSGGSLAVLGWFDSSIEIGGVMVESIGGHDGFVAVVDETGDPAWHRTVGSGGSDRISALEVGAGSVTIGGDFERTVDFGGGPIYAAGDDDSFVASYAEDGTHEWSTAFGGADEDGIFALLAGPAGELYAVGHFAGDVTLGTTAFEELDGSLVILRLE